MIFLRLKVDEINHHLILDNKLRVAVVYFRAGYSPSNYPTETEWTTRRIIELSDAVKCPWIGLQLANTKKVQQVRFHNYSHFLAASFPEILFSIFRFYPKMAFWKSTLPMAECVREFEKHLLVCGDWKMMMIKHKR